jgi:hypothetical protein
MIDIIIGSILCAGLYRAGGTSAGTWLRDWILPIVLCIVIGLMFHWSWWLILLYIATAGALTSYWSRLFGFDNLWFHGFMVGVASFPLYFMGVHWWLILARACLLAITIGGLNVWINQTKIPFKDWIEELFRGFILVVSLPILFLNFS